MIWIDKTPSCFLSFLGGCLFAYLYWFTRGFFYNWSLFDINMKNVFAIEVAQQSSRGKYRRLELKVGFATFLDSLERTKNHLAHLKSSKWITKQIIKQIVLVNNNWKMLMGTPTSSLITPTLPKIQSWRTLFGITGISSKIH